MSRRSKNNTKNRKRRERNRQGQPLQEREVVSISGTGAANKAQAQPQTLARAASPGSNSNDGSTNTGISAGLGPQTKPPPIAGGRQTQPINVNPLGLLAYSFLPRRQYQDIDLSDLTLGSTTSAQELLELFADLSPEVSLALWNEMRMVNTDWSFKVMTTDGKREVAQGKALLDELIDRLNPDYGGLDTIINSWTYSAFMQGAIAGEIALTEDLDEVDDIYPVQPRTIYFMRDGEQKLVPFQQQVAGVSPNSAASALGAGVGAGAFGVAGYPMRRLNTTTFGYLPMDAAPDDPYGRPPSASVLQLIAFDLQVLKDLRQATHTNAWGRLHIKVLEEVILKNAPANLQYDPTGMAQREFVNAQLNGFVGEYNKLKPDDAFITTDAVDLKPVDFSGKTVATDVIIRMIERRLFRALKQLPVLMGSNEGTTETHGTVQMDIYAAGIKSIQKLIARLLQKLLGVALQIYGIGNAKVIWEFEAPRANDRLKDIQADQALATLLAYQRDQGWITNDDASIQATGSKAVADPKPAAAPSAVLNFHQQQSGSSSQDEDSNASAKGGKNDDSPSGTSDSNSGKKGDASKKKSNNTDKEESEKDGDNQE